MNYYREVTSAENCGIAYNRFSDPTLKDKPAIRTYPYSPDQVCVQIRTKTGYASASLRTDIAREFAEAILTVVATREERKP